MHWNARTLQRVEFNDSDLHFQKTRAFFFRTKSLSLKFLLPYDTFLKFTV